MIELHTPRRFLPVKTGRIVATKKLAPPTDIELKKANTALVNDHMRDTGLLRRLRGNGTFNYDPAVGGAYWFGWSPAERIKYRIGL